MVHVGSGGAADPAAEMVSNLVVGVVVFTGAGAEVVILLELNRMRFLTELIKLDRVVAVPGGGVSKRLVWYRAPGPSLEPTVEISTRGKPRELVRCSWRISSSRGSRELWRWSKLRLVSCMADVGVSIMALRVWSRYGPMARRL